jgi:hypothetical protein
MPSLILETAVIEKVWGVDVRVKVGKAQARPWAVGVSKERSTRAFQSD